MITQDDVNRQLLINASVELHDKLSDFYEQSMRASLPLGTTNADGCSIVLGSMRALAFVLDAATVGLSGASGEDDTHTGSH